MSWPFSLSAGSGEKLGQEYVGVETCTGKPVEGVGIHQGSNFDCSLRGFSLQVMDSSHVAPAWLRCCLDPRVWSIIVATATFPQVYSMALDIDSTNEKHALENASESIYGNLIGGMALKRIHGLLNQKLTIESCYEDGEGCL